MMNGLSESIEEMKLHFSIREDQLLDEIELEVEAYLCSKFGVFTLDQISTENRELLIGCTNNSSNLLWNVLRGLVINSVVR